VAIYDDYRKLLENGNINGVVIATPTFTKKGIEIAAADADKHNIAEKPLALNLNNADEMIRHVEKQKVKVLVDYQRRYDRAYALAEESISQSKISIVLIIKSRTRDPPLRLNALLQCNYVSGRS
jgi:myo-inositol 2-dehydrogenase/D-chiro-inositol 1-dehydrogenase